MSRERRILLAAAAFLLLLVLLATEGALRASGLYSTWSEKNDGRYRSQWKVKSKTPWLRLSGKPNTQERQTQAEYSFEIRTNSEGLRDVDHDLEKSPGSYRLVLAGSSYTEGAGAAFEDTYPQVVQRMLAARGVEVLAAGVSGSDPVFVYQLLVRRLVAYAPDLVVLTVNESDVFDMAVRGGMDRFDADGFMRRPSRPLIEIPYRFSHVVRAIAEDGLGYDFLLLSPPEQERRYSAAVSQLCEAVEAIRELGEAEGFGLLAVRNPNMQRIHEPESNPYVRELARLFEEAGIAYLDLREPFREAIPPGEELRYAWPIDNHYNARGYALMATVVVAALDEIPGFPPPRKPGSVQGPDTPMSPTTPIGGRSPW